ncbi:monovalent cation/H+ antiporter subunit D family protein [candidate division GN15 bacterium]|nr:monovalent cation/H+ antiporter subunit D family protein [candidate division GN15 bacterium]
MTSDMVYTTPIPFLAIMVSLIAVPLILLSRNRPNLREGWTLAAALVKFALILYLLPAALQGRIAEFTIIEIARGIDLQLRVDPMGIFFALVASSLWILTSFYSIGYVRGAHEKKQTRYFASFAVCLSATIGIAFSANLLTFLIFYEILSLATYPLVVHKESDEAYRSGRMYLVYALTAGVILIAAVGWTYLLAGSADFVPGGLLAGIIEDPGIARALFIMFMVGVGVKAGIMPLHSWLPRAMVAPTPVSALLHAVAVVKSGVFGVIRIVGFVFGPDTMQAFDLNLILAVFAGATIILASLIALRQDNLKALLAYSTVGHLSYIVLGMALLSPDGFLGGIMHLANHATMKITLFFCAGAIYVNLHKTEISELDGIGRTMPWTMSMFAIGALGLAGVPPINGFVSKLFLCLGALQADQLIMLGILLVSGLLNAAYFFPIIYRAFLRKGDSNAARFKEASLSMVVPICIVGVLSVLLGFFPNLFFHFYDLAAAAVDGITGITSDNVLAGTLP